MDSENTAELAFKENVQHRTIRSISGSIRTIGGASAEILESIPTERGLYSALGGLIIAKALLASLSLAVALTIAFGALTWWVVMAAFVWGAFVLSLDRSLVASLGGDFSSRIARVTGVVFRVLLAGVCGLIIAEPLVIGLFSVSIDGQIAREQPAAESALRQGYDRCNPVPGGSNARPSAEECANFTLVVNSPASAQANELATLKSQESELQQQLNADSEQYRSLAQRASAECSGQSGAGLSGVAGDGAACRSLRRDAEDFRQSANLDGKNAQLLQIRSQVSEAARTFTGQADQYEMARNQAIEAAVLAQRSGVGFLEKVNALSVLATQDSSVGITVWTLRVFLILVECMPVVVKIVVGRTAHDRLRSSQLALAVRRVEASTARETMALRQSAGHQLDRDTSDAPLEKQVSVPAPVVVSEIKPAELSLNEWIASLNAPSSLDRMLTYQEASSRSASRWSQ